MYKHLLGNPHLPGGDIFHPFELASSAAELVQYFEKLPMEDLAGSLNADPNLSALQKKIALKQLKLPQDQVLLLDSQPMSRKGSEEAMTQVQEVEGFGSAIGKMYDAVELSDNFPQVMSWPVNGDDYDFGHDVPDTCGKTCCVCVHEFAGGIACTAPLCTRAARPVAFTERQDHSPHGAACGSMRDPDRLLRGGHGR